MSVLDEGIAAVTPPEIDEERAQARTKARSLAGSSGWLAMIKKADAAIQSRLTRRYREEITDRSRNGAGGLNAAQFLVRETLNDGSPVTIRAARPDDKERIVTAFRALAPQSIYARFFHAKPELSKQELRQLTEIDSVSAVVLLATIGERQQETVTGVGRYVANGGSAEVAFVVADDYVGRGIASRLLHHLTHIARENGMTKFEADVLEDNAAMLAVLRDSGLPMTTTHADGLTHVTLLLCNPEAP